MSHGLLYQLVSESDREPSALSLVVSCELVSDNRRCHWLIDRIYHNSFLTFLLPVLSENDKVVVLWHVVSKLVVLGEEAHQFY